MIKTITLARAQIRVRCIMKIKIYDDRAMNSAAMAKALFARAPFNASSFTYLLFRFHS